MTESPIVKGLKEGKLMVVYEEDDIVVFLDPAPVTPGHMVVAPKDHYTIVEEVPDWLMGRMGEIANKASTAAFETLGAKGTNILIHNGTPAGQELNHLTINVIPRFDNDGLNFMWQPKQLTEEEMSTVELTLKQETELIGQFETKKPAVTQEAPVEETAEETDDSENYMLKQITRIP
ncbi:MAG: HIT family protein [Nanoarchaeota archaeon]|nr:HIT family protein [Nanoarchaeota archaeon]